MNLGQRLKAIRAEQGLSQEQVAEKLSVTRQTVANWEKGKTIPDIRQAQVLAKLYGVHVTDLLDNTEDEQTSPPSTRQWNLLFESAILLFPFGSLVAYWGLGWLGLILRITGMVMLPPLWVARYKQFGMPREDMRKSLTGWGLILAGNVLSLIGGITELAGFSLCIIGLLMIHGSGIYLERGKRFWLVIFLYLSIPGFISASLLKNSFDELGVVSKAQPFGQSYRIESAVFGDVPDSKPIVSLDHFGTQISINNEILGEMEYRKPLEGQQDTVLGTWHLVPEDNPKLLYKLEVNTEQNVFLSCYEDDHLQWQWLLQRIPGAFFNINSKQGATSWEMPWYQDQSADPASVAYGTMIGTGTAFIRFDAQDITALTVTQEYHHNGEVEVTEYTLTRHEKHDCFYLPEDPMLKYEESEQFILYRFIWEDGAYLFRLNLN